MKHKDGEDYENRHVSCSAGNLSCAGSGKCGWISGGYAARLAGKLLLLGGRGGISEPESARDRSGMMGYLIPIILQSLD